MHRAQHVASTVAILAALAAPGCSAVIDPNTSLLDPDVGIARVDTGLVPTPDMGLPLGDAAVSEDAAIVPGDDAGNDAAVILVDAGSDAAFVRIDAGNDAGAIRSDAGNDAASACVPGVECTGYAALLGMSSTLSTNLSNCVVQMHRADCCGARDAYGVNHAARTMLCNAETSCVAQYPAASCTDATIHTDDGDSTTVLNDVRLHIVDPQPCGFNPAVTCYTCETFVCRSDTCRSAPGVTGGCG